MLGLTLISLSSAPRGCFAGDEGPRIDRVWDLTQQCGSLGIVFRRARSAGSGWGHGETCWGWKGAPPPRGARLTLRHGEQRERRVERVENNDEAAASAEAGRPLNDSIG